MSASSSYSEGYSSDEDQNYSSDSYSSSGSYSDSSYDSSSDSDASSSSSGEGHFHEGSSVSSFSSFSSTDSEDVSEPSENEANDEDLDFEARHARALKKWGVNPDAAAKEKKDKKDKQKEPKRAQRQGDREGASKEASKRTWRDEMEGMSEADIIVKLRDILSQRSKRSTERAEQRSFLREAINIAREQSFKNLLVESLRGFIGVTLEHSTSIVLTPDEWMQVAQETVELYTQLYSQSDETISAAAIAGYVDRLQASFHRGIRNADPFSPEYRVRLEHLPLLHRVLLVSHAYLIKTSADCTVSGRALESVMAQTYYMDNKTAEERWQKVFSGLDANLVEHLARYMTITPKERKSDGRFVFGETNCDWIKRAATEILSLNLEDAKVGFHATCYFIQNRSINGYVEEARSVVANTLFFETAQTMDITEQIQYNRSLCQLGLAAFRVGNAQMAANLLSEICSNGKQRELLAQGVAMTKGFEKTLEQEKSEKRRLLPQYLHINLDLIECAYNICSMIIEVPNLRMDLRPTDKLAQQSSYTTSIRSLRFRRILDYTEKSFVPPETSREIIFTCARSLLSGEYEKATELLKSLKFWTHLSADYEKVQALFVQKFKEIALTCYVQKYAHVYISFSSEDLAELFDLTVDDVYIQISRMILRKELNASWDGQGEILHVQESLCTPLQTLSLNLLKPLELLVETNEQIAAAAKK